MFLLIKKGTFFGGCLCGVMVKVLDYGIKVHELDLQSRYHIHFQTNTLILPDMG